MNAKNLIAAVAALAVTGSAFAVGSDETVRYDEVKSTKTRAEVMAELRQAQRDGTYVVGGSEFHDYAPNPASRFARTERNVTETARNGSAGTPKNN